MLDPKLEIVAVTDAYLRATMTRREDILGRGCFDVFPDNPAESEATGVRNLRSSLERVLQTKAPDRMAVQKYDIRRPDGTFEVRYWSPLNVPVLDAAGELAFIIHRVEDVTKLIAESARTEALTERSVHMQAELVRGAQELQRVNDELRMTNEALGRTQRFLDAVVENIPNMVFVKDAKQLAFELFNRAGEQLLGLPRAQLLGKTDFDFFPRDEAEFFQRKDRETLASGKLLDIPEEPIQTGSGRRWLHTKKVPILDEHGEPQYLLGISEEITELKAAQDALRRAHDETAALNNELEAFSYSVSHDLRAPLRSIDGFSQAVLEDYGSRIDPPGRDMLERIRNGAQRMGLLIDDLLRLSRVTRSPLMRAPVNLSELSRGIVDEIKKAEPQREVEVVIADGLVVNGDGPLLRVAMENLWSNAWKFTSKTPKARIELGVLLDAAGARTYFLRDNGAGFDMAYAKRLFSPFQRLHGATEYPGTGIGLATVSRIVQRHGGRVWADAVRDQGATFFFQLEQP